MTEAREEYDDTRPDEDDELQPDSLEVLDQVRTGDPQVDEVLAGMDALHELPVEEHAGVFEDAHDSLRQALDPDRRSA